LARAGEEEEDDVEGKGGERVREWNKGGVQGQARKRKSVEPRCF
jgi:hypothetical protein